MEKITVKKVALKVQELKRLREIVLNELVKSGDVQFYLEKSLYEEIRFNFFDYNMEPTENESKGHYAEHTQNVYELQNKKGHYEGMIEFIANVRGYMQITAFEYGGISYLHYNSGMKKIIQIVEYKEIDEKKD